MDTTVGTICVDTHSAETSLYEALVARFGNQTVIRRRLDVGDVELTADAGLVVFERKTWADLAKSLSDGRYAEQKARILSLVRAAGGGAEGEGDQPSTEGAAPLVHTTAIYIVEGALTGWAGKVGGRMGGTSQVSNAQLEAAIVSTSVRDGVPVLRSKDTTHTVELITYLFGKLRLGEWGGAGARAAAGGTAYAGLLKKRKRDNLTTATTWEVMLAQVQGMSANKASVVAAAFPTMTALAAASVQELAALLVPASGRDGKARRLGPAVAQRLVALA